MGQRRADFQQKLTLDKQLGELYDSGASPEQISTLESKIDALDDEYWDLQPKLAELDKKYAENSADLHQNGKPFDRHSMTGVMPT